MPTAGSLFSGVGLLDYGLHLAGWEHAWFVEKDAYRRGILGKRWPGAAVHDDVRTVRDLAPVDLVAGGFPCRGVSAAGQRNGLDHPETALWHEFARILADVRPRLVLIENVANLLALHRGRVFGTVLGDLAALGYGAWWDCLPAAAFGAPHLRDRVFLVALADDRGERPQAGRDAAAARRRRPEHGRGRAEHAADAEGEGSAEPARSTPRDEHVHARRDADGRRDRLGPPWSWGAYEPAIRRWEAIHGPAPQPLVPRMADGRTRGVDGPRVSALGDGVLVHAGHYLGSVLMQLSLDGLESA